MRAVWQAVSPLEGEAVSVELGGAPRLVDVGRGAGAVGDVLGDAGRRVVAVLEGEHAQSPGLGEACWKETLILVQVFLILCTREKTLRQLGTP